MAEVCHLGRVPYKALERQPHQPYIMALLLVGVDPPAK